MEQHTCNLRREHDLLDLGWFWLLLLPLLPLQLLLLTLLWLVMLSCSADSTTARCTASVLRALGPRLLHVLMLYWRSPANLCTSCSWSRHPNF